ncbi:YeeE/YedE thiosulfate transporter family protein [Colwelliaceae bacterium BS250]
MALLIFSIVLITLLGYLAQFIGLCMVRGVNEWREGKPEFLLAIVFSGAFSWLAYFYANYFDLPLQSQLYQAGFAFALGGFIFGLGSALNNGCGVSTLNKLTRGDLSMIATMFGWLLGWLILSAIPPMFDLQQIEQSQTFTLTMLVLISAVLLIWILRGSAERRKLWLTMFGIGLLAGVIFLYEPGWTPSSILRDTSHSMLSEMSEFPSVRRLLLFTFLLMGMFISAIHKKSFKLVIPTMKSIIVHTIGGVFMGVGAALALGGNDSQLLVSLPTLSPASIVSVLCIILGIRAGQLALKR